MSYICITGSDIATGKFKPRKMKNLRKSLKQFPAGHGHKKISIMLPDGTWLDAVTNNMPAIDAAFDPDYNEDPDVIAGGRFYESREEAQDRLIEEVIETYLNDLNDEQFDALPDQLRNL